MGYQTELTEKAHDFIAEKGWDEQYGARPLKRAIRKYIEDPVSEHIIADRMFGRGIRESSRKLRIGLSRDKESTTVEWR